MKNYLTKIAIVLITVTTFIACKGDDSGDAPVDPNADNKLILGASAEDILSDDFYTSVTIEFVYADGFRPMQGTLDGFQTLLSERINKPGGVLFVETVIDPPPGAPYNSTEIREIEDANRTKFTEGTNIAIYIFFSNGSAFGDTQSSVTLGSAYRNTSMVVYEKTLKDLVINNPNFDLAILESTTLHHEFGHVLGLTNILDDDIHTDHEDEFHPKHCIVEDCLMYFEAQAPTKAMLARLMSRASVPGFDPLCIGDLQSKGGK